MVVKFKDFGLFSLFEYKAAPVIKMPLEECKQNKECVTAHYLRYGQGLRSRIHLWFPDWITVPLGPVSIIVP